MGLPNRQALIIPAFQPHALNKLLSAYAGRFSQHGERLLTEYAYGIVGVEHEVDGVLAGLGVGVYDEHHVAEQALRGVLERSELYDSLLGIARGEHGHAVDAAVVVYDSHVCAVPFRGSLQLLQTGKTIGKHI